MKARNRLACGVLPIAMLVAGASAANAQCLIPAGDIDGSGSTTIVDVQCQLLVLLADLGGTGAPSCLPDGADTIATGDRNCDLALDVSDTIIVINYVLGVPLDETLDPNGNGVVEACEVYDGCGEDEPDEPDSGLHPAFLEFDEINTDIFLEDGEVVVETNGFPNHTTPYWGEGHELYSEPVATTPEQMTPSIIPNFDGATTLRIPVVPSLAPETTATTLGTIGISVSGAAIFNDQEGGGELSGAAGGLDYSGGHIGPGVYHYHIEPKAFSDDDENLIGVMADGFFIYGRKCASTGTYPDDLDESGGHVSTTQHASEPEYHYHIINELYVGQYYLLFAGDFQGVMGAFDGGGGDTGGGGPGGGGPGGGGPGGGGPGGGTP